MMQQFSVKPALLISKYLGNELLHQLAKIKEVAGNFDQALQVYKRILDISPDDEKAEEAYLRLRLKLLHKREENVQ